MISRRAWLAGAVASTAALARRAHAQTYPSRVIKMIVPFAPGGPADTMARLARPAAVHAASVRASSLDNRGGAGGTIAAQAPRSAAEPDGYTLMFGNTATLRGRPRGLRQPSAMTRSRISPRSRCSRPAPTCWSPIRSCRCGRSPS